ncbi:beta-lactamase-like protein [Roridomyces roridus]|uniref:Beta-lactamase-like protein n=1 Tax=Roridomyces roridus TaxID=1738132 RepID=A0AAD7FYW3_9AGAR|nr:beta-lactamase-like protein [Roridomyces roridus]
MFLSSLSLFLLVSAASASLDDLGIPQSNALVTVKAFDLGSLTAVNGTGLVISPVLPGQQTVEFPLFAFLVEHNATQKRIMFDLGMRTDVENFAPSIAEMFAAGIYQLDDNKDITEVLQQAGINLTSIDTVIWSHSHFDHTGDMSKFPNTTKLVIGPGTDTSTYPTDPNAVHLESDFAGHNLTELDFTDSKLVFSGLPALDYFGDGSFYLMDTPGHISGHISALARVTPTTFVALGGDTFHHVGEARPRPAFQTNFPCPGHLVEELKTSVSTDYFWSPNSQIGSFDIESRAQQMLAISDLPGSVYEFPVTAQVSLEKIATFDADPDVLVVIAHDISHRANLPTYPASLNDWKANGYKEQTVWNFANKSNPAFLFDVVA